MSATRGTCSTVVLCRNFNGPCLTVTKLDHLAAKRLLFHGWFVMVMVVGGRTKHVDWVPYFEKLGYRNGQFQCNKSVAGAANAKAIPDKIRRPL